MQPNATLLTHVVPRTTQPAATPATRASKQQLLQPPHASNALLSSCARCRCPTPRAQVLHIRNLPPDVTEQELLELCRPFGRVTKVKLNTGESRNQCFVEFESVNCAIQMIYSFVGSADPPKARAVTSL